MQATKEEIEWASRIKQAACQDPSINQAMISDLEYLHHAIVAKDQIPKALKRLRNMQTFKESYGIQLDGSYEEAERDIKLFLTSHPDMMLSVASNPESHHMGVFCGRYAGLNVQRIQSEEAYCVLMRGLFYTFHRKLSKLCKKRLYVHHHAFWLVYCGCYQRRRGSCRISRNDSCF